MNNAKSVPKARFFGVIPGVGGGGGGCRMGWYGVGKFAPDGL